MKYLPVSFNNRGSGLPVISIFLAVISLLLYFCSDVSEYLQYDRTLIADGEIWRCITGHWTHWTFDHFLWCVLTFLALGGICEGLTRKGFIATLVASSLAIPLVSWFADPSIQYYRGLSGLGSGIFIFAALMMARTAYIKEDRFRLYLSAAAGVTFAGKVFIEFISEHALFVNSPELFTPVPLVHLTGGGVGLIMAFVYREKASTEKKRRDNYYSSNNSRSG